MARIAPHQCWSLLLLGSQQEEWANNKTRGAELRQAEVAPVKHGSVQKELTGLANWEVMEALAHDVARHGRVTHKTELVTVGQVEVRGYQG